MRKIVSILIIVLAINNLVSQELNCLVNVNYQQISGSNVQVFKTLEKSLTEFINQTKWTNRVVQNEEKVDANIRIKCCF